MNRLLIVCVAFALAGCTALDQMGDTLNDLDLPSFGDGPSRSTLTRNGNCPSVARVAELSSLYQFTLPARPDLNEKISEAHIARVDATCKKQGKALKLDLKIDFGSALGPRGRIRAGDRPSFAYPYFIAVTNDRNQILAKDIYAVAFGFDADDTQLIQTESISQMVPLSGDDPRTYRILVGFQLSGDEVTYNRKLPDVELGKNLSVMTVVPQ